MRKNRDTLESWEFFDALAWFILSTYRESATYKARHAPRIPHIERLAYSGAISG